MKKSFQFKFSFRTKNSTIRKPRSIVRDFWPLLAEVYDRGPGSGGKGEGTLWLRVNGTAVTVCVPRTFGVHALVSVLNRSYKLTTFPPVENMEENTGLYSRYNLFCCKFCIVWVRCYRICRVLMCLLF